MHVSRTFSQLTAEGLVHRQLFQLIILDVARLREVAAFEERYLNVRWGEEELPAAEQQISVATSPITSRLIDEQKGEVARK